MREKGRDIALPRSAQRAHPEFCTFLRALFPYNGDVSLFLDRSISTTSYPNYQGMFTDALDVAIEHSNSASRAIYTWGTTIRSLTREMTSHTEEELRRYYGSLCFDMTECCGATDPQLIAEKLIENRKLCNGTVLIMTDGQISNANVEKCRQILASATPKVDIERLVFVIDGSSDPMISVYQPFAECAREVHAWAQGEILFSGHVLDISEFERLIVSIDSDDDAAAMRDIYASISALRVTHSANIINLLRDMRQRVETTIRSRAVTACVDIDRLSKEDDPVAYAAHVHEVMSSSDIQSLIESLYAKVNKMMTLARLKDECNMSQISSASATLDKRTQVGRAEPTCATTATLEDSAPITFSDEEAIENLNYELDLPCIVIARKGALWPALDVPGRCYSRVFDLATMPDNSDAVRQRIGSLCGYNFIREWFASTDSPTDPLTRQRVATLFPLCASRDQSVVRTQKMALYHLFIGKHYGSPIPLLLLLLHYVRTLPELSYLRESDPLVCTRLSAILTLWLDDATIGGTMPLGVLKLEDLPRDRVSGRLALAYLCSATTLLKYFDAHAIMPLADTLELVVAPAFVSSFRRLVMSMQYCGLVNKICSDTKLRREAQRWLLFYTNDVVTVGGQLCAIDGRAASVESRALVLSMMPAMWLRSLSLLPAALQEHIPVTVADVEHRIDAIVGEALDVHCSTAVKAYLSGWPSASEVCEQFRLDASVLKPIGPLGASVYGELVYKLAVLQKGRGMDTFLDELARRLTLLIVEKHGVLPHDYDASVAHVVQVMRNAWYSLVEDVGERSAANTLNVRTKNQQKKDRKMERRRRNPSDITSATCNSRKARRQR